MCTDKSVLRTDMTLFVLSVAGQHLVYHCCFLIPVVYYFFISFQGFLFFSRDFIKTLWRQ